jgi:hypothetical protein
MQLSQPIVVFSALTLFLVMWQRRRAHDPGPSRLPLQGWGKVFGVIAFVLVVLMMMNPDFLAFGFAMDAAYFDLLVLLLSIQLQSLGSQSWRFIAIACAKTVSFITCYLKRLAFGSWFLTIQTSGDIMEWACTFCAALRRTFTRNGTSVISL